MKEVLMKEVFMYTGITFLISLLVILFVSGCTSEYLLIRIITIILTFILSITLILLGIFL